MKFRFCLLQLIYMLNNMYMYLGKNVTQVDMGHVEPKGSTHQNSVEI